MTQEEHFIILRSSRATAQMQLDGLQHGLKIVVGQIDRTATHSIGLKNIIRKYDQLLGQT